MAEAAPAPAAPTNGATPSPAPAAVPPTSSPAAIKPEGVNGGHAPAADAANEPPPPDWKKAGLVYDAESKEWGRRIKVDGKEVFFALGDEKTWQRAGLGLSAHQVKDKAAREVGEARALLAKLEGDLTLKDPKARARAMVALYDALGVDARETVQAMIEEAAEHAKLSPEQKRIRELEEKSAREESEKKRLLGEQQRAQAVAQRQADLRAIRAGLQEALPAAGLDPANVHVQLLAATRMEAVLQATGKLPDMRDVAQWVRATTRGSLPHTLKSIPEAELLDALGEENVRRLLAAQLARQKAPPKPGAPIKAGAAAQPDDGAQREPETPGDRIRRLQAEGKWAGRT